MEDLGDLLYVLFIVAALVISALKKRKQQDAVPPFDTAENDEEYGNEEWDDEPEEVVKRPEVHSPEKSWQHIPSVAVTPPKPTIAELHMQKMQEYQSRMMTNPTQKTKLNQRIELEETEAERIEIEDADWRRAIIFSEILKRPEHFAGR